MTQPPIIALTPFTRNTPQVFLDRCMAAVAAQDYPNLTHLLMPNNYPPNPQKFGNHARARNAMLDAVDPGSLVLWVDADIVDMDSNTVAALWATMRETAGHAVAPQVRIEPRQEPQARGYSDLFYDTAGFIFADGEHIKHRWRPVSPAPMHMQSVGCVYLLRRWAGSVRYVPKGDEVEHISLLAQMRDVYMDPTVTAWHANLPAYGLAWH